MRISEADLKKQHAIEQLEKLGHKTDTRYTYKDLIKKLTVARALEVDNEASDEQWF